MERERESMTTTTTMEMEKKHQAHCACDVAAAVGCEGVGWRVKLPVMLYWDKMSWAREK